MKKYLVLMGLGILMSGCKYENKNMPIPKESIEIDAKIALTKATESTVDAAGVWQAGDKLGMYINNVEGYLSANREYTWDVEAGKFMSSIGLFYDSYAAHDIFGYYPYLTTAPLASLSDAMLSFNVKADQSGKTAGMTNYTLSDLMYAKKAKQIPQLSTANVVDMQFDHKLSNVRLILKNVGDEAFIGDVAPVVKIVNTNRAANLNLLDGSVSVNNTAKDVNQIVMNLKTSYVSGVKELEYLAIAVPQVMVSGSQLFYIEISNDDYTATYTVTLAAEFKLESGKEHLFTIINSGVDLTIGGGEVLPWGEGVSENGTSGGDGVKPSKLIFELDEPSYDPTKVASAILTIDNDSYSSTAVAWNADKKQLTVTFDQGAKWGSELKSVKLLDASLSSLVDYTGLTNAILGDPTLPNYDKVIILNE